MKEDGSNKEQWTRIWRELGLREKYQHQCDLIVAREDVQHDLIHLTSYCDQ